MNNTNSNKRQLLDPIGTLSHIVALAFKPLNTKIGISNHAVKIQDNYYLQWFDRLWNNDNRENISLLYSIVIRVIEWYVIPLSGKYVDIDASKEEHTDAFDYLSKEDKDLFWKCLEKMILFACMAFDKLQYTYNNGPIPTNVILATQFFINTLKESLKGTYNKDILPRCLVEGENKTFIDYQKIKLLWNGHKLSKITSLYEKCFDTQHSDNKFKDDEIDGYMAAINKLLSLHDDEFRQLISYSNEV
jgi:hypothetical protein